MKQSLVILLKMSGDTVKNIFWVAYKNKFLTTFADSLDDKAEFWTQDKGSPKN